MIPLPDSYHLPMMFSIRMKEKASRWSLVPDIFFCPFCIVVIITSPYYKQDRSSWLTSNLAFCLLAKRHEKLRMAIWQSQIPVQRPIVECPNGSVPFLNSLNFTPEKSA